MTNKTGIIVQGITLSQDLGNTWEHITYVEISARVSISYDLGNPHLITEDEYLKLIGMALLGGKKKIGKVSEFNLVDDFKKE